jgi:hypothetical protein
MIYRVLDAWLIGNDPSGKDVKLLLQGEMGHHTEVFNLDEIGAYLAEHHPDLCKKYSPLAWRTPGTSVKECMDGHLKGDSS